MSASMSRTPLMPKSATTACAAGHQSHWEWCSVDDAATTAAALAVNRRQNALAAFGGSRFYMVITDQVWRRVKLSALDSNYSITIKGKLEHKHNIT